MQTTFLSTADGTRLSKRYTATENQAYPNVLNFDSYEHDARTLEEFYELLQIHAAEGHCLLKGGVSSPLRSESRAGSTDPLAPTEYIVLDLDTDHGFADFDAFLASLGLGNVSYVLHHSSSAGIRAAPGLRAHAIILLDKPASPPALKLWLKHKNLTIPALRDQITLNATGMSLRWPLDVSTCQNDKLIFIADPTCEGVDDPLKGKRFGLVYRTMCKADPDLGANLAGLVAKAESEALAALREAAGLPKRKPTYSTDGPVEYLKNPDKAVVTGAKVVNEFIRLNLNGGDSWAYYYPAKNPEFLYSFKGDPPVRLRDIDPEYYAHATRPAVREDNGVKAQEPRSWVFRNPATDTVHAALYDGSTVQIMPLSRPSVADFCSARFLPAPDFLPEYSTMFDPSSTMAVDHKAHTINLFRPTGLMRAEYPEAGTMPAMIRRVLSSIAVDEETYDHLVNWIAFIFQRRERTQTAWIFRGAHGTGKGVMFNKILKPIFGRDHAVETTLQIFGEKFNGYMEQCLFLMLDEGEMDDRGTDALIAKTKNLITEPTIDLRRMRTDVVQVPNFTNLIVACNKTAPIRLEETDRRWNVAPAQETPIGLTQEDVDAIEGELPQFCAFLAHYKVDANKACRPLANQAKHELFLATENSVDRIFRAFKQGDLDFFAEHLMDTGPSDLLDPKFSAYSAAVRRWMTEFQHGEVLVTNGEVRGAYEFLTGNSVTPVKFGRIVANRWRSSTQIWANDTNHRGWWVRFQTMHPDSILKLLKPTKLRVVT